MRIATKIPLRYTENELLTSLVYLYQHIWCAGQYFLRFWTVISGFVTWRGGADGIFHWKHRECRTPLYLFHKLAICLGRKSQTSDQRTEPAPHTWWGFHNLQGSDRYARTERKNCQSKRWAWIKLQYLRWCSVCYFMRLNLQIFLHWLSNWTLIHGTLECSRATVSQLRSNNLSPFRMQVWFAQYRFWKHKTPTAIYFECYHIVFSFILQTSLAEQLERPQLVDVDLVSPGVRSTKWSLLTICWYQMLKWRFLNLCSNPQMRTLPF